jgi:3-isopropylmalate/(R)-2-methylmalate dehydratase large subunit
MTLCEKIIASRAWSTPRPGKLGVPAVQPGDALFVRTDVRFSHEYVTPMADALFAGARRRREGHRPASVYAFRDHLTFLDDVMPEAHVKMGLREQARRSRSCRRRSRRSRASSSTARSSAAGKLVGSEAICHNIVIEDIALPGQVVDRAPTRTPAWPARSAASRSASAHRHGQRWFTKDVRVKVPESVRVNLRGALRPGRLRQGRDAAPARAGVLQERPGIGKVLEFAGDGVKAIASTSARR